MDDMGWCRPVKTLEATIVDAVLRAESRVTEDLKSSLSISTMKSLLSNLIRAELRMSNIPFEPLGSGNSDVDYLVLRGVAVIRVKGLNKEGKPTNYPTDTALAYHLGDEVDSLPDLPPLPRVDLSYRLEDITFGIHGVELLEWREGIAIRRYQLPLKGASREIEVAAELDLRPRPTTVRPRKEASSRRPARPVTKSDSA